MRSVPLLLLLPCLGLSVTAAALAEIRSFDSTPPQGLAGDLILTVVSDSAPVRVTPGVLQGASRTSDDGAGSVTLESLAIVQRTLLDVDTENVFGPGSFILIDAATTDRLLAPHIGSGSSDAAGSVTWGIVSQWSATGSNYCVSSPVSICNSNGFAHGVTAPKQMPSFSYDLGTWSFDAIGDYEATPYIVQTANGNESNIQYQLRGRYLGSTLPALPVVGLSALAAALAVVGGRALTGRRGH